MMHRVPRPGQAAPAVAGRGLSEGLGITSAPTACFAFLLTHSSGGLVRLRELGRYSAGAGPAESVASRVAIRDAGQEMVPRG